MNPYRALLSWFSNVTLRNKLLYPIIFTLFVCFFLFTIYLISDQREKGETQLQQKADSLTQLITYTNLEGIWNFNEVAIRANCESFFKVSEIIHIKIMDNEGNVLIDMSKRIKGSNDLLKTTDFIRNEEKIGKLEVTFTNHYIEENLAEIRNNLIFLSLIVFIIVAMVIFYASGTALRPLELLMNGVKKLYSGDLFHQVPVISNDELGKLAQSFNSMATEVRLHQENLETMVDERTRELLESNKRLEEAMNALWGEMELAKKIQTVLLPHKPAMTGFDIAASLDPADEVGGDYYDVISVNGFDWLIIGDVSGHGVPAGLIMMMVQTAIHTVLNEQPSLPPAQLMSTVNRSIAANIARLGESKYMTMTVMAAIKDGNFSFAGLHQDILIYRSTTKNVEAIETRGMWLGVMPDIEDMLEADSLKLNLGDTMILYTDGVTEAEDVEGKMFGNQKLTEILRANGDQTAQGIHQKIINALINYKKPDDVTLLVIKRMS